MATFPSLSKWHMQVGNSLSVDYNLMDLPVGLSQLCSKICLKCFWEFPKKFPYYAQTLSYYARLC